MSFVFLHTEKVVEGSVQHGLLLYPSAEGRFRSDEDKNKYAALFQANAPPCPYFGAGKRFGPTEFSNTELREAALEHMKRCFSPPKDIASFWDKDEDAHRHLKFPLIAPSAEPRGETPLETAVRSVWECSGIKLKTLTDVGEWQGKHVFTSRVFLDTAKWEWMNHQAERLTLTDWGVCPHDSLLDDLGVPKLVVQSYCRTHGGPRFVTNIDDHLVDETTLELFHQLDIGYGV